MFNKKISFLQTKKKKEIKKSMTHLENSELVKSEDREKKK